MATDLSYITSDQPAPLLPLARYLPLLPAGLAEKWLSHNVPPGSWVLDPFGATPQHALEAARAGYRVLVAANNPILAFMVEILAEGHTADEFRAALADLAAARRGDERLEIHIQALYATECSNCGRRIGARAFLYSQSAAPYACLYRCPYCGDEGERKVSEDNLAALARVARGDGLHRARALERVAPLDDPNRADVEEALNCYLPRPLYTLTTLINKLDSLPVNAVRRRLLSALLISACDQGNTLWQYPTVRARPKQLTIPHHFRENNLWLALEEAIPEWSTNGPPIPFSRWPQQPPPSGGICLYQGRLRELAPSLPSLGVRAALTALPRPNQAFWTLSALWTGWLWGGEAVQPMRSALSRRRYDWNWHAIALGSAFSSLAGGVRTGIPVFAVLTEVEQAFIAAAMIGAASAGLELQGAAYREDQDQAQITWITGPRRSTPPAHGFEASVRRSAAQHLASRGEPASYAWLAAAVLADAAREGALTARETQNPGDVLSQVQNVLRVVLSDRAVFTRFGGSEHSIEVGMWALAKPPPVELSLSDRVERTVEQYLRDHPACTAEELDQAVCQAFPGPSTPDRRLVQMCLESYGEPLEEQPMRWRLRSEDEPTHREADLAEVRALLITLGERLGFQSEGELPLIWREEARPVYAFYPITSASVDRWLLAYERPAPFCCVVLPGGRANLLSLKLRRNPRLERAAASGWHFIKFRNLRRIADLPLLTRESWIEQIQIDPPESKITQMDMF